MARNNPYQAYKTNAVTTASPGELTLMLYNGCLKFINLAKKAIEANQIEEKNTNIKKAQNIISELMVTLNMDMAISKNMMALYDYAHRKLIEANIHNDTAMLIEVEELMTEFRDTWKQAIQVNRQQQHTMASGGV
ncbi:flagellar export chaperone FliS [Bacillus sp. FJAT-50079]|uniref:flagellar export chaperone FliS n=1 Tax=Bacillus sp. FJAT-50079 TaxID=2833577 RepID=UPI001BC9494C|nr:flagellar export chaperone FliS [Bacillus sp. FJAT-50079]MBS4208349.1 flagellar export chaperone FliS [Bacillus sp. FJAT-50079]